MIFVYWEWWMSIEATKICYFGLALSGIGSQPTRLSDVLNLKNLKTIEISSWFFASIEATKNILFWVMLENTLGQSVCRSFYFWFIWLVNLDTGCPLLHCTCSPKWLIGFFWSFAWSWSDFKVKNWVRFSRKNLILGIMLKNTPRIVGLHKS